MSAQRLLAPLYRRLRLIAGRCLLEAVDDSLQRQNVQVQLLAGEVASDVEHFQQAGFTSVPLPGAIGLYLATGGKRSSLAALLLENKERRPTGLKPGETCLYHIGEYNHFFILENDGVARLVCKRFVVEAEDEVVFDTPVARFTHDIDVAGISKASDHDSGGISGKGHAHTDAENRATSTPNGGG